MNEQLENICKEQVKQQEGIIFADLKRLNGDDIDPMQLIGRMHKAAYPVGDVYYFDNLPIRFIGISKPGIKHDGIKIMFSFEFKSKDLIGFSEDQVQQFLRIGDFKQCSIFKDG